MDDVQVTIEAFSDVAGSTAENPKWVHLLPLGPVTARDGRTFTVNEPALIIARSTAGSTEVPVDYEHQTLNAASNGKPAPAAGWVKRFEVRADGIWGLIEWTAEAFAMIKTKAYRFISPTVVVNKTTREVDRIANAGLTNMPALTLTPLQRQPGAAPELEQLADALGLDKAAGLAEMIPAIKQLRERSVDPAEFVPASQVREMLMLRSEEMNAVHQERVKMTVETAIASGKVTPALKSWAMEYCGRDMAGFEAFVATVPAIVIPGELTYPTLTTEALRVQSAAEEAVALQLQIDPRRMK